MEMNPVSKARMVVIHIIKIGGRLVCHARRLVFQL